MKRFLKEHKWLLCAELTGTLICLAACFIPEKLAFSATADEVSESVYRNESNDYHSDPVELLPGVYRLEVQAKDHESTLYAAVQAQESTFQALRCNGTTIYPHQREAEFAVYVTDRIETAYISCNNIVEGGQPIETVRLYRTSVGWRLLLFLLLLVECGFNLLVWLRDGVRDKRLSREHEAVFWGIVLSTLLAYLPYATDYFSIKGDGAFHLLRIEGLTRTLLDGGQFPVRVQEYWLYGHGYAVSSFYGDLFLVFPALLRIIGFSLMTADKLFVLAVLFGTAVIAYVSFYGCTRERYSALFGSVLYQLAPYHIYNIYNRNAVGEYLAMMFLPLVMSGIYRIYAEDVNTGKYGRAKIPLIAGLSCILQSHILSCEMVVVTLLLTCLVMWKKTFQKERLKELVKAAVWCLLINAWFWVSLLKMLSVDQYYLSELVSQNIQSMGTRIAGILQIYPYVGGGQTGMYNGEPIQLGAAFWCMFFGYIILRNCRGGKEGGEAEGNPYDKVMRYSILGGIFALFLSTRYFPWDRVAKIPVIGMLATALQFPTRLLTVATAFFAFAACFFVVWVRAETNFRRNRTGKIIATGCIMGVVVVALWSALYHVNDISYCSDPIRLYNAENLGTISVVNGEYLLSCTDIRDMGYHEPVSDDGLEWQDYVKEGLSINMDVSNQTQAELYMELPVTGYKGYVIDAYPETEKPYITEERGAHGDIRIAVPAGYTGKIKVYYKGFAVSRAAEFVSGLAILLAAIGWWVQTKAIRRERTGGYKGET